METSNPFISVVIPAYNESSNILACLKSVTNQTFKDFEIIVIDDGSDDNTVDICEKYAEVEPRLRVVKRKNSGVSSARNSGLDVGQGEYIYFVDAVDYILPECFESFRSKIEDTSSDIVLGDFLISADGNRSRIRLQPFVDNFELLYTILSGENHSGLWNKIFRKKLFEKTRFPEDICYMEDRVLMSEILLKSSPKVSFISDPVYVYSVNTNSVSCSGGAVLMQALVAHERISSLLRMYDADVQLIQQHNDSGYRSAWYLFRNIRPELLSETLERLNHFFGGLRYIGGPNRKGLSYLTLNLMLKCHPPIRLCVATAVRRGLFGVSLVTSRSAI